MGQGQSASALQLGAREDRYSGPGELYGVLHDPALSVMALRTDTPDDATRAKTYERHLKVRRGCVQSGGWGARVSGRGP